MDVLHLYVEPAPDEGVDSGDHGYVRTHVTEAGRSPRRSGGVQCGVNVNVWYSRQGQLRGREQHTLRLEVVRHRSQRKEHARTENDHHKMTEDRHISQMVSERLF